MQKILMLLLTIFFIIGCTKQVELDVLPNDTYDRISKIIPLEKMDYSPEYESTYLSKKLPDSVMGIDTRNLQIESVRYDFDKKNRLCAFYMTIIGRDSADKLIARIDSDTKYQRFREDLGIWYMSDENVESYSASLQVLYDLKDDNKAVMSIQELWQCYNKD